MTISALVDAAKTHATFITTCIGIVTSVGGAVLYVNNNYAHAEDIKDILKSQQQIIQLHGSSQRQQVMFQLEYYDDRLKRLNIELDAAMRVTRSTGQNRTLVAIQSDIDDTKVRREMARKQITD